MPVFVSSGEGKRLNISSVISKAVNGFTHFDVLFFAMGERI